MKQVTIVVPNGYADMSTITGSFEILTTANEHWREMGNPPVIEIRIAGTKASCEKIPPAFGNPIAVHQHIELTSLTGREHRYYVQALLDEGHETRDLDLVVLSGRAVNDFDLHSVLQTLP